MNTKKLVVTHMLALGTLAVLTEPAFAIDLYVDNDSPRTY